MSIGEQGGKVTSSAIEALKGNPLCLALVVLVAIVAVSNYFKHGREQELLQKRYELLLEKCMPGDNDADSKSDRPESSQ